MTWSCVTLETCASMLEFLVHSFTEAPLCCDIVLCPAVHPVVLQGSSIARDMRTSIHRCLVFLGDLSRYASQAAPKAAAVVAVTAAAPAAAGSSGSSGAAAANTAAKAEWSKAVGYYRMAAHVLPRR